MFYIYIFIYGRILIMKKVLALLFASTLVLGACDDKNDDSKKESSSNSTDNVSVEKYEKKVKQQRNSRKIN